MGNAYLDKQRMREQQIFEAGEEIGFQRAIDYFQWILRQPQYVGKDIFGRQRWETLYKGLKECDQLFGDAFTHNVDADYCQEKLDAHIREIFGTDALSFYERHPKLKKFSYSKPKKGWV